MRSLHLVTHPEATHVVERLVGGWYDSDLTARGAEQAERIAAVITARVPSNEGVLFSSDLRRARRTAELISAALGVEPVLDAGLREQSYGVAEGLPVGTVGFAPLPAVGDRLRHHDGVSGSETRLDLATRVYAAVGRVIDHGAEDSVVVTHGGTATFVIAAWVGMPLESLGSVKFKVSPGSISVLRQDGVAGDRQVISLNELGHLC
jgi:probable phosphoglycerate mutase